MWVFGVRLPADSDTPGGGDATIESEGLAGWTEDFDRALATARTSVPVSQATLVAYKVRWVVSGVLLADDAVLTEIDEALQVAEQSSDRQRDSRCWPNSAACALSSVTRWMRFPCGLRARGCPPMKRWPTHSVAAENVNAQQWLGVAHAHRARHRTTGQRSARQQRHRDKAFRLTPHRANPPHLCVHKARADLARATRPGGRPTRPPEALKTLPRVRRSDRRSLDGVTSLSQRSMGVQMGSSG
jgi:hypothetical protein